jgi:methionine--tRNA ligase beta chain
METISFDEWQKLDLRVARIKNVEEITGADKLYKLTIDVGELGERTICAGIKQHYEKKELIGKEIIIVANLEPRKMKGIESQGMLLAACNEEHTEVILLKPKEEVETGSKLQFKIDEKTSNNLTEEIINIDEFSKFDFRIGKIESIGKGSIKIKCLDKVFETKQKLDIKKGDFIVIVANADKIVIPTVSGSVIVPEKEIEEGSKVS